MAAKPSSLSLKSNRNNDELYVKNDCFTVQEDEHLEDHRAIENDSDNECKADSLEHNPDNSLEESLRLWALSSAVPRETLKELFTLLQKTTNIQLPNCTSPIRNLFIKDVIGGQIWYHGVENSLQNYFRNISPDENEFSVNLCMTGIPLDHDGPSQFWPILISVPEVVPALVVGIYFGLPDPKNVTGFLDLLVKEINRHIIDGITINDKLIKLRLRCIIADAPTRAFIQGVSYQDAMVCCMKCKAGGQCIENSRKVIFPGVLADKRTDKEFRNALTKLSTSKISPLIELSKFNFFKGIIVGDRRLLIDLGVMRKLLNGWVNGSLDPFPQWSSSMQHEISELLIEMKFPSEISHKLRSLNLLSIWKADELCTFLHYASIAVLKHRISNEAYQHFKLFYCAITFLSSKAYEQHWEYAGQLLEEFVKKFSTIYDKYHLTTNVHNLLHITAEVRKYGPLSSISSYPFEEKFQNIRDLVRHRTKTLEGLANIMNDIRDLSAGFVRNDQFPLLKTKEGEVNTHISSKFCLRKGHKDGWFLTKSNVIVQYISAELVNEIIVILGYTVERQSDTFSYPCSSQILHNYKVDVSNISPILTGVPVNEVKCKLVALLADHGSVILFYPLLHTLS